MLYSCRNHGYEFISKPAGSRKTGKCVNRHRNFEGAKMSTPKYEYGGLMAATWDLFRGDTSTWDDRFFFRKVVEQCGQPVLDVGCGTGRFLLDFMSQGIDID